MSVDISHHDGSVIGGDEWGDIGYGVITSRSWRNVEVVDGDISVEVYLDCQDFCRCV